MEEEFEDLRIGGIEDATMRPNEKHVAMRDVSLNLSTSAPHEWSLLFNELWSDWPKASRSASTFDALLRVYCPLRELDGGLMVELQRAVAETNAAYRNVLAGNAGGHRATFIIAGEGAGRTEHEHRLRLDSPLI